MKPSKHVVISAIVAGGLFAFTRNVAQAAVCFGAGVFMDIDHFIDYYTNYRKLDRWSIMYERFMTVQLDRLFLFFHSYELMVLMWGIIFLTGVRPWMVGVGIGCLQHLICDQIGNPEIGPFSYFFIYRLRHRFDKNHIAVTPANKECAHENKD